MIYTIIGEENQKYFQAVIGEYLEDGAHNRLMAGVINDDGEAVGAGVFSDYGEILSVDMIAVTREHRRKGVGSFLLAETEKLAKKAGMKEMSAELFVEEGGKEEEFISFLNKNGFVGEYIPAKRTVYPLDDMVHLTYAKTGVTEGLAFVCASDLTDKQREQVESAEENGADTEALLSGDNEYGGFLFKGEELICGLAVEPFLEGVRFSSVYSTGDIQKLLALFDIAAEKIRSVGGALDFLYVDTVSEGLAEFESLITKKHGASPEKVFRAYASRKEV